MVLVMLCVLAAGCSAPQANTTLTAAPTERATVTSGDYEYAVLENGTVEIVKYSGSAKELVIPQEIDGRTVTSIGNKAFLYCDALTSVSIPDSVTSIGEEAFAHCPGLTLIVPRGSFAAEYCQANGLTCTYTEAMDGLNN